MKQSLIEVLGRTELFGSLSVADRQVVAARMRPVQFAAHQEIFARGDPGLHAYLVTKGRIRLSVLSSDGRELSLDHATPGRIFGEIAALDGRQRTASATAITRVEAMSLSQQALTEILEVKPSVAMATIRLLCLRLRDTDQRLEAIALHRIEVRLARMMLSALRPMRPAPSGRSVPLDLGMSQGEIALLVGASRSKVNRALTMLEDMGAINRVGSAFACNIEALEDIADMTIE